MLSICRYSIDGDGEGCYIEVMQNMKGLNPEFIRRNYNTYESMGPAL